MILATGYSSPNADRNASPTHLGGLGGFALLDILIVVGVLTIVAGIALPIVAASIRVADTADTTAEMEAVCAAIENFYHDNASFPARLDDLTSRPAGFSNWQGPYVNFGLGSNPADDFRYDAWLKAYKLVNPGPSSIALRSWGTNRENDNGGGDDIERAANVTPAQNQLNGMNLDAINTAILSYNRYLQDTDEERGGKGKAKGKDKGKDKGKAKHKDKGKGKGKEKQGKGRWVYPPLRGPWSNVLSALKDSNLLPVDPAYNTDIWGNSYICGPDPVEYVTSTGP